MRGLEAGKSTPYSFTDETGATVVVGENSATVLVLAEGELNCGQTVFTAESASGSFASCRRLENLEDFTPPDACDAVCEVIPYSFSFNAAGDTLDFLVEPGTQCASYQCTISWLPQDLPQPRATLSELQEPFSTVAGSETSRIPATTVQFLASDPRFQLQPCQGVVDYLPAQELAASATGAFVPGDLIRIVSGSLLRRTWT